ncbi:DNA mismatch repair protein MutS [Tindallia magadiensis]|uniref:DNA mismatch repair protein MutS n=1 Tax=Tindallia magadiensis TaxID=69895 RepID=A0A1I3AFR6_9FIRM|nr:DNA mismatch repair protein MutS [Tindallia magadiensis]SFH48835.1 DNA mismatch repair protein MutS [Tindallia magadiensis]
MAKLTPMMQQFFDIKNNHQDSLLFFRLGDFYELFFEDALIASKELDITLTGRNYGQEERAPMCGVPHHSAQSYIDRLIHKGYKVAICEQVEEPEISQGIVKREVIRVITPGTAYDSNILDENNNHYLLSINYQQEGWGITYVDLSTGEMLCTQNRNNNSFLSLVSEINKINPGEIIYHTANDKYTKKIKKWLKETSYFVSSLENTPIDLSVGIDMIHQHFNEQESVSLSIDKDNLAVPALVNLFYYLETTQKRSLSHITSLTQYKLSDCMTLDQQTRRNLELTETIQDHTIKGSLLGIIDQTKTSMGGRLLRKWINEPLTNDCSIEERLDAVTLFVENTLLRKDIRFFLKNTYDIERLVGKIGLQTATPRDLLCLKQTLTQVGKLNNLFLNTEKPILINKWISLLDPHFDLITLLDNSIDDDAPTHLKDGGIIKEGYDNEIDELKRAAKEGKEWIAQYEREEREKTGIKSLKTGYNKVFGYYLEVSKSYIHSVPEIYQRKQTLANCERYITDPLKELEAKILGAEERLQILETQLFKSIRESIKKYIFSLQQLSKAIAGFDVISSLAETAFTNQYVRPVISSKSIINIKNGRHPVIEKTHNQELYVPNDSKIDAKDQMIHIITGPNMAGKSTYMRQVAIIVLLAQIGSYVPAEKAELGVVDRIFTRIGASDDLSQGRSTFMMEMSEVSTILKEASSNSLIILDEVGRGTSTFDGLSIAWSLVKYIHQNIKAKTLFSTHYHELTELSAQLSGICNYRISVREDGQDIIFLRKVIPGTSDKSYGIQVARLAGLPESLLNDAKDILNHLEQNADVDNKIIPFSSHKEVEVAEEKKDTLADYSTDQEFSNLMQKILNQNIEEISPIKALNFLHEIQEEIKKSSNYDMAGVSRELRNQ